MTPENYEAYKKISRAQCEAAIKGHLAIKAVGMSQGLSVPQNEVDAEVMAEIAQLQSQIIPHHRPGYSGHAIPG